jgi:putative SOS response-associated peptidase YedK
MCGRTSLTVSPADLRDSFALSDIPVLKPRFNIAPTQPIATIRTAGVLEELRWGLVPFFSEGPKSVGGRWINARAETIAKLPVFRDSFAKRRCLIVIDGFYEWIKEGKSKRPFHIRRVDRQPFALAGVWDKWRNDDKTETIESCSIVTCASRGVIAPIHDRMPVILAKESWELWMQGNADDVGMLLVPRDPELITIEVSSAVNSVKNDGPECQALPAQTSLW